MKSGIILALAVCLALAAVSCGKENSLHWKKNADGMALTDGKAIIGKLDIPNIKGVSHKEKIEALTFLMHVVGTEIEVICPVPLDDGRRP